MRLRHFDRDRIAAFTRDFGERSFRRIDVHTMNGHAAAAFQYLGELKANHR